MYSKHHQKAKNDMQTNKITYHMSASYDMLL